MMLLEAEELLYVAGQKIEWTQRGRKKRHYRWFWRRGGGERTGGGAEKIGREQGRRKLDY